ncbi:MAG TPA: glycosyl transferase [Microbacterium sp.]|nr:glycosyl transferase [Microbacterium sp.]
MPSVVIIGTRGYPSYYGGFETAIRKLAPYLADAGWDVCVYSRSAAIRPDDETRDPRVKSIITRGVENRSLSTLSYGFTSTLDALRRKPDVALVMNVANGFWLPLLRAARIPTLVNVDGIEWERAKWGRLAKVAFRSGAKLTARHATELVVDAAAIGDRWLADFGRSGVFIPYGGDAVPEELSVEQGLQRRGYVLMVARFVPENTIDEFFRAAPVIAEKYPVVIVGSSGYGGEFDERARRLATNPRIHWLGHVSDDQRLLSLWQHCGVYFHGHSVGGTNPALVQAMAAGAPVVARDTVYNREVLAGGGKYTSPLASSIADDIIAAMTDEAGLDRVSEENVKRARDVYGWDAVNSSYEGALRALVRMPNDKS